MAKRTNEEWTAELRGNGGKQKQRHAHEDLSIYLHRVAYNQLLKRQNHLAGLRELTAMEIATLAQDFVQTTLLKLAEDNFRRLEQFGGRGRFTSWAAAIVVNEVRQELRSSYWTRRSPMPVRRDRETREELEAGEYLADESHAGPEDQLINQEVQGALQKCIHALSDDRRQVIEECQLNGRPAQELADEWRVTSNAIYILIYRAKQDLRRCLGQAGFGPGDLAPS